MALSKDLEALRNRKAPIEISADAFRDIGHRLVDQIANHLAGLRELPVTPAESGAEIRRLLASDNALPETGADPGTLLHQAAELLFAHSLFNGHPRFLGYITSSAAPVGVLGDFLAAAVNPNVGAWKLAPVATEIEAQTVRWIAELIGYPSDCGGLLVSGGNMANFVCFLAARAAKASWDVRQDGLDQTEKRLRVYASSETHTWIQKATDLFGLGTSAIRWIPADANQRLDPDTLRRHIDDDLRAGDQPFLVVGTAGSVSTGAVDPLHEIAALCLEYDLWFHADGAYGALAAQVSGAPPDLEGIIKADSVAVDPHKWLYTPLEAGCVLMRNARHLQSAFSYHPPYYHFDPDAINYFDLGPQNSRGFRALKVWLGLRQAGRTGYLRMMADDILLAHHLRQIVAEHPELEAFTHNLSITTFRYVPSDLRGEPGSASMEEYLDRLNQALLGRIEKSGEAFLSNALVEGKFVLRACIVNFRTSLEDVEALPELVVRLGKELHASLAEE